MEYIYVPNLKTKNLVDTSFSAVMTRIRIAIRAYLLFVYAEFANKSNWNMNDVPYVLQLNPFDCLRF